MGIELATNLQDIPAPHRNMQSVLRALYHQQLDQALRLVERSLPDLNNVSAEGAQIFLVCYRVLALCQDPRADGVLRQGYAFIQAQCATLRDERLRNSFLTQVAVNRILIELAQQAGIDKQVASIADCGLSFDDAFW